VSDPAATWKLVPTSILAGGNGRPYYIAPVTRVVAHPPHEAPPQAPVQRHLTTVEIKTSNGTRWYGFADARITSGLRMAVRLAPGQERDRVVASWETADACEVRQ
jgi:hypothetical protein